MWRTRNCEKKKNFHRPQKKKMSERNTQGGQESGSAFSI